MLSSCGLLIFVMSVLNVAQAVETRSGSQVIRGAHQSVLDAKQAERFPSLTGAMPAGVSASSLTSAGGLKGGLAGLTSSLTSLVNTTLSSPCPGFPPCDGAGACDPETGVCTCPAERLGPDCSLDRADYTTVVLPCTNPLPEPLLNACKRATEAGECSAYRLFAEAECASICPYLQGGNCTVAAREHTCHRTKVRCPGMCMSVLSWFCNIDVEAAKAKLEEMATARTAALAEAAALSDGAPPADPDAAGGDPLSAEEALF